MRETILFDAVTNLSDVYVEEASTYVNHRPAFFKTVGTLAACLALVVTVTLALPYLPLFRAGSSAPEEAPGTTESAKEEIKGDCFEEVAPEVEEEAAPLEKVQELYLLTGGDVVHLTQKEEQYILENTGITPQTVTIAYEGDDVTFQDQNGNILESDFNGQRTTAEVVVTPAEMLTITVLSS